MPEINFDLVNNDGRKFPWKMYHFSELHLEEVKQGTASLPGLQIIFKK